MKREVSEIRGSLLDLAGIMNAPQPDAAVISAAGVALDRALFPVLMRVQRYGPIGIGELADLCGRDYTTLSRQVSKLEELGLVTRRVNVHDSRIKEALLSKQGTAIARTLENAREKIMLAQLADWHADDLATLARLLRRLADDALRFTRKSQK